MIPIFTGIQTYVKSVIKLIHSPIPSAPYDLNFLEYLDMFCILVDISIRFVNREKAGARVKQGEKRQRKPNWMQASLK